MGKQKGGLKDLGKTACFVAIKHPRNRYFQVLYHPFEHHNGAHRDLLALEIDNQL
jgi:hypothetical protein